MAQKKETAARGMSASYSASSLLGTDKRPYEDRGGETVRKGIEQGFKRTTILVHEDRFHVLTAWAAMQGETVKDVLDEAISSYIDQQIPDYAKQAIEQAKRG